MKAGERGHVGRDGMEGGGMCLRAHPPARPAPVARRQKHPEHWGGAPWVGWDAVPGGWDCGSLAPVFCGPAGAQLWGCPGRSLVLSVIFCSSQLEDEKSLILLAAV